MIVNVKEIQDIIHAMPVGKAPGYDSVSNEHFKYANEKLHVLMSLLYSSMLIHGFFTGNKAGDLSDNITTDPLL